MGNSLDPNCARLHTVKSSLLLEFSVKYKVETPPQDGGVSILF